MPFTDKWERKEQGPSFAGRIIEKIRTPTPIKVQIEQANRQVRLLIGQLNVAVGRIKQRDEEIFRHVVASLARHDNQHAIVYANELSEIRKLGKMVTQAQLAMEQISLRLGTITDLGEIASSLAPAVAVIRSMKDGLQTVMPDAEREMGEISGLLSSILVDASATGGLSLNFDAANEEARKVLDEAASVAEERMKENFPEIPSDVVISGQTEELSS